MAMGIVYLIESIGQGLFKIGITSGDPKKRLISLQTASPFQLRIFGIIESDNTTSLEREIHKNLLQRRKAGEWFKLSPDESVALIKKYNGKILVSRIKISSEREVPGWAEMIRMFILWLSDTFNKVMGFTMALAVFFLFGSVVYLVDFYSTMQAHNDVAIEDWEKKIDSYLKGETVEELDSLNAKYEARLNTIRSDSVDYLGLVVFKWDGVYLKK